MRKSLLALLIIIQILALFILENMFALFASLEKNEIATVITLSELQADLHIQRTQLRVPRPGREKYFDRILPMARAESSRQVSVSGRERLLQIRRPN